MRTITQSIDNRQTFERVAKEKEKSSEILQVFCWGARPMASRIPRFSCKDPRNHTRSYISTSDDGSALVVGLQIRLEHELRRFSSPHNCRPSCAAVDSGCAVTFLSPEKNAAFA